MICINQRTSTLLLLRVQNRTCNSNKGEVLRQREIIIYILFLSPFLSHGCCILSSILCLPKVLAAFYLSHSHASWKSDNTLMLICLTFLC